MELRYAHSGSVVRLGNGQEVVAAVGPGHGRRYVMQASGVMLDARGDQEVEVLGVPWSPRLAKLLIKSYRLQSGPAYWVGSP